MHRHSKKPINIRIMYMYVHVALQHTASCIQFLSIDISYIHVYM